ncbi:GntR family transcriptional regulator [Virgibacillus phasianinus]|uniref:GntR family transcriptional regulator n=1 Tax=Virgibacillus phasianinus TaxID=2017483 RepID=A0A220TZC7_9BACI|nr:GntR family transcriptional regulator [Virgibacillus phasianinus]ASK60983.1 GntR family transcriptional regulator [Virgibacillus phasianinus]
MGIQKTSLVDIVVERIKSSITEKGLRPGDKYLSEKELVDLLQVSRTVVREALISLQTVGILQVKPGGGVYIAGNLGSINTILKHHYDTHGVKIRELIEIRKIIELGALRLIIEKDVNVNIARLNEINESYYQQVIEKQDTKKFDRLFHQSLIKATDNESYYNFSEIINEYFSLVKIDLVEKENELIEAYKQHLKTIQAIENKNLPLAQQIMSNHFEPILAFINQMEEKD